MGKLPKRTNRLTRRGWGVRARYSVRRGAFFMPAGAESEVVMTEENTQEVEQTEEPQGEAKAKTDWKAEARKWENLAKKGKAAEEELAKLKEAQMTEQEKANARAEKAEAKLAEMVAEQERLQTAREYATKESVPVELLEFCKAEDMDAFCKAYKAAQIEVHAVPSAVYSRVNMTGGKVDPRSAFVAFANEAFNK